MYNVKMGTRPSEIHHFSKLKYLYTKLDNEHGNVFYIVIFCQPLQIQLLRVHLWKRAFVENVDCTSQDHFERLSKADHGVRFRQLTEHVKYKIVSSNRIAEVCRSRCLRFPRSREYILF